MYMFWGLALGQAQEKDIMMVHFLNSNGTDKVVQQYYEPGRSYFAPLVECVSKWAHVEGDIVCFHTGYGCYAFYSVVAQDAHDTMVQRIDRDDVAMQLGALAARGDDTGAERLREMLSNH